MFKAVHADTGEDIIILQPAWLARIGDLRALAGRDLLVCQGCRQALRVKAGTVRRPHFAHKHRQACSFGSESPDILEARAVLYHWLHRYFGDALALEHVLPDSGLPRPVDCWVETPSGPRGYWLVEAGVRLETREAIQRAFSTAGAQPVYIFLARMLNEEKKEIYSVLLTPTERAFLQPTPYDALLGGPAAGGSLHYLDADQRLMITYRGLLLFHRPNWFKGHKKTAPLDDIRVSLRDGAIVYPGEQDRLGDLERRRARLERKRQDYARRTGVDDEGGAPAGRLSPTPPERKRDAWSAARLASRHDNDPEPEALECATCGQQTTEYWSTFFRPDGRKMCRCRACLERSGG